MDLHDDCLAGFILLTGVCYFSGFICTHMVYLPDDIIHMYTHDMYAHTHDMYTHDMYHG